MLQIKCLNKYFGDNHVLRDISPGIESHKTIAIIGSPGSGRSTLLRYINLLETPDSGSISLNGKTLDFSGKFPRHQKIASTKKTDVVFQSSNLFPHKTTLENIMGRPVIVLKKSEDKACQSAMELLKRVRLEDEKDSYSHQLSEGQQRGTAIAEASAIKSETLLFDKPTSTLDPELGAGVLSLIKELLREEYTIIVVTHNISLARGANEKVVFVEKGEILVKGSYDELVDLHNNRISQFLGYLDQGGDKMDIKTIKSIICFGSLIMSISIHYDGTPTMGEAVYTYEDYNMNPGEEDDDQSVAVARSGGNVTPISRVAAGEYAHQLTHSFQRDHIDTDQLKTDRDVKTGVVFVWVGAKGHNKYARSLGVSARITPQDIQSYAHLFAGSSIVMITLEHNSWLPEEVSPMTRQSNYILIIDPSSKGYFKFSPEIADRIDTLKPSEMETEMLTSVRVETEKDAVRAMHISKEKDIRMPMISLGSCGAVYGCKGRITYVEDLWASAVDTTIADDIFIGSMAAKLLQGCSFRESIGYTSRAATYCVQHRGA